MLNVFKRSFSTTPAILTRVAKLNCSDCRLYDGKTGICKLNGLSAIKNRVNESVCGLDGKKYWALDKTNLIESRDFLKYSLRFYGCTIVSIPSAIVYDFRIMAFSYSSWVLGWWFEILSKEYEKKYLEDNDIHSHDHTDETHKQ